MGVDPSFVETYSNSILKHKYFLLYDKPARPFLTTEKVHSVAFLEWCWRIEIETIAAKEDKQLF